MDEARFGQQGTLTAVWADKGSRPTAVKQTKYEWVYLYAAVDPIRGDSSALLARHVNTGTMGAFLEILSREVGPDDHVVLVLDNAGWHGSKRLQVPENITLFPLPPYCPEQNPIERLWHWLKDNEFSNRVYPDAEVLLEAVADMWNTLNPERIQSVCHCSWTHTC